MIVQLVVVTLYSEPRIVLHVHFCHQSLVNYVAIAMTQAIKH